MSNSPITQLFNKFTGRIVKDPARLTCDIDTVYEEMKQLAEQNGFRLRLKFPGRVYTRELKSDRITGHVTTDAQGRYVVSNRFDIG